MGEFILIYLTVPPEISQIPWIVLHLQKSDDSRCDEDHDDDDDNDAQTNFPSAPHFKTLSGGGFHSKHPFCVSWLKVLYV